MDAASSCNPSNDGFYSLATAGIFTGVSNYTLQTEMPEVQFDDDEILTARMLPSSNWNTEIVEMVLLAILFPEKKEDVKILQIEAEDVTWEVFLNESVPGIQPPCREQ